MSNMSRRKGARALQFQNCISKITLLKKTPGGGDPMPTGTIHPVERARMAIATG
jgi:hypothetical protein